MEKGMPLTSSLKTICALASGLLYVSLDFVKIEMLFCHFSFF
jgi:hypothetical protein